MIAQLLRCDAGGTFVLNALQLTAMPTRDATAFATAVFLMPELLVDPAIVTDDIAPAAAGQLESGALFAQLIAQCLALFAEPHEGSPEILEPRLQMLEAPDGFCRHRHPFVSAFVCGNWMARVQP